jgi:RNA polymerase sigma factor (sigma-70 family)
MEAEPNHAPRTTQDQLQRVDQQVVDAVNILSEDERNVIEVAVMSGHSIRDTARILGMPASTVQRLKQKALTKLREEIQ